MHLFYFLCVTVCLHVCVCVTCLPAACKGQNMVSDSLELEWQPCGCWDTNLSPLQEQPVLRPTQLSLQPLRFPQTSHKGLRSQEWFIPRELPIFLYLCDHLMLKHKLKHICYPASAGALLCLLPALSSGAPKLGTQETVHHRDTLRWSVGHKKQVITVTPDLKGIWKGNNSQALWLSVKGPWQPHITFDRCYVDIVDLTFCPPWGFWSSQVIKPKQTIQAIKLKSHSIKLKSKHTQTVPIHLSSPASTK